MISRPSCRQLLDAVRAELSQNVVPAVSDPKLTQSLGMIDAILRGVAVRCDHEIAWMRAEIAEIDQLATTLIDAGADDGGRVAEALADLRDHPSGSDHVYAVQAEYDRAGEVLSRCMEAAVPAGGVIRKQAVAVLQARLAREVEIRGDFALVGRG